MDRERTDDVFRSRTKSDKSQRLKETRYLSVRDVKLAKAYKESEKMGKLTPLLKEELKCRIHARRHSEGKHELVIKFEDPPMISKKEMSPEYIVRLEKRREQNRRASRKLRVKKRDEGKRLMDKLVKLDADRREWQAEIEKLNTEKTQLNKLLGEHRCIQLQGQSEVSELKVLNIFNETVVENSASVENTHVLYNVINSHSNNSCLPNSSIDTDSIDKIRQRTTPDTANGPSCSQTSCMLGIHITDTMPAIDVRPGGNEQLTTFDVYSDYPICSTDTILNTNLNCTDMRSLDESNPYTSPPDTNLNNLHSPAEQKTTDHFSYPEHIDLAACGSLDLNQSIQLEDMIRQYNCDVSFDHSCLDMSYFNMVETGLPVTP